LVKAEREPVHQVKVTEFVPVQSFRRI
jgi:hypothetical protein